MCVCVCVCVTSFSPVEHLHHFDGVGQAAAKVVRRAAGKHLRLARQPAERACLDNTVAIALKGGTIVAGWRRMRTCREHALVFAKDTQGMQVVNHRLSVA